MTNTSTNYSPQTVAELRELRTGLTRLDVNVILSQAEFLIDRLYAHLVLKKSRYGIDPIAQLRRLGDQMTQSFDEVTFNQGLETIFSRLRDLHTQYIQPLPLKWQVAYLPFVIDRYYEAGQWHYIITQTSDDLGYGFAPGVEVTHFNGAPMEQAVLRNAATADGSNPAAFFASGLYTLTNRMLAHTVVPDTDWVNLTYLVNGRARHIRVPWRVYSTHPNGAGGGPAKSVNEEHLKVQQFKRQVFDRNKTQGDTSFPDQLQYGVKKTPYGEFGWLRVLNFEPDQPRNFLLEVARILKLLPPNGLIIDIRGNPGGIIPVGETMLQLFTDRPVTPEPLHFRATIEALAMAEADESLAKWAPSIKLALNTGELYSAGFPLTGASWLESFSRVYPGKSVLITDALCYSTASFFTAGFQDNEIGPVICLDDNIGGGGANVWEQPDIAAIYPKTRISSPILDMPKGTNISLALLQSTRVGKNINLPLTELGIQPDYRYFVGQRDLKEDFVDMFNFAGKVLAGKA